MRNPVVPPARVVSIALGMLTTLTGLELNVKIVWSFDANAGVVPVM